MTILNHVELLKIEKDGLEVLQDIERYGSLGFSAVTADDIERFKWLGLYQQSPKAAGYFMMRIKIPGGLLNATQLRTLQVFPGNMRTWHPGYYNAASPSIPLVTRKTYQIFFID